VRSRDPTPPPPPPGSGDGGYAAPPPTWIGLAFTPILRPLLPGPYQLGVITATNPGSGKTKLANME
jgi:hypothetical protein